MIPNKNSLVASIPHLFSPINHHSLSPSHSSKEKEKREKLVFEVPTSPNPFSLMGSKKHHNCTRENSILSLGSNSYLTFEPVSDCSSNSSMILSFDQEVIKDPNTRREKEIRKLSQGLLVDQEENCFEIYRSYEKLAKAAKENESEEEIGWFCSEDLVRSDNGSQKRQNSVFSH